MQTSIASTPCGQNLAIRPMQNEHSIEARNKGQALVITNLLKSIATFLAALLFAGCNLCGNELQSVVRSSDGKFSAVVYLRSCGATTGFSTHVSIVDASQGLPDEAGNVLITHDDLPVSVEWLSNAKLSIHGTVGAEVWKLHPEYRQIQIIYSERSP